MTSPDMEDPGGDGDCVFCAIVAGNAEASPVYEDSRVLAFLDIRPVTTGHLLVVPKAHAPFLADLDADVGAVLFRVAQQLAAALRKSGLPCEGVNLFLADGEPAGQEVFHVHLHVFPRITGDGFHVTAGWTQPTRAELDEYAVRIRRVLEPQTVPALAPPSQPLRVRRAGPDDSALLARLRRSWDEEDESPSPLADDETTDAGFEQRFADWYAAEASRRLTWLAEDGDRPVGMLNLAVFERMPRPGCTPARWGYVGNVFVLAGYRDRGIGRALLEAALDHARAEGFTRVVLHPSPRSVPFYRRAGFVPADQLLLKEPP